MDIQHFRVKLFATPESHPRLSDAIPVFHRWIQQNRVPETAIDVSDSDDPELGEKIAALQARHQQEHPEIAAEIAQAASFTVPDGAGQPAAAG